MRVQYVNRLLHVSIFCHLSYEVCILRKKKKKLWSTYFHLLYITVNNEASRELQISTIRQSHFHLVLLFQELNLN